MNRILVPIDFSDEAKNTLKYAFNVSKDQALSLSLLHCYSSQKYNFGELDYEIGIKAKLSVFYIETTKDEEMEDVRFLAKEGFASKEIIALSSTYKLITLSGKSTKSRLDSWIGNGTSNIVSNTTCPVLIIPPNATYGSWESVWRIKRHQEEVAISPSTLSVFSLSSSDIRIKTLDQEDFTSHWWQAVISYIKTEEPTLLETIQTLVSSEAIDLFLLQNDLANNLQYFFTSDSLQVIFQFQIPVFIFHKSSSVH